MCLLQIFTSYITDSCKVIIDLSLHCAVDECILLMRSHTKIKVKMTSTENKTVLQLGSTVDRQDKTERRQNGPCFGNDGQATTLWYIYSDIIF